MLLAAAAPAAQAQTGLPPDPRTVTLPDLTTPSDPEVIKDGWKHFYFHKAGVAYEEAYADFSECYAYMLVPADYPSLPMFAPWVDRPGARDPALPKLQYTGQYGLVGAAIGALFFGSFERRLRQAPLRRCLETRGYVRYPLPEKAWEALIDDYSDRSIAMQAKAATLPAPDARPVTR